MKLFTNEPQLLPVLRIEGPPPLLSNYTSLLLIESFLLFSVLNSMIPPKQKGMISSWETRLSTSSQYLQLSWDVWEERKSYMTPFLWKWDWWWPYGQTGVLGFQKTQSSPEEWDLTDSIKECFKTKSFSRRNLYEITNVKLKFNCWPKTLLHFAH